MSSNSCQDAGNVGDGLQKEYHVTLTPFLRGAGELSHPEIGQRQIAG